MTRRADPLERLRRDLYFTQRSIGDWQAAKRGVKPIGKRLVRRSLTRALFRRIRF